MNVIHSGFKRKVEGTLATLISLGVVVPLGVFQWSRTWEKQAELYELGRTKASDVCVCQAHPLGLTVTNAQAGDSWHQYGLAADLVFKPGGKWSWDYQNLPYAEMGKVAMELGLEWGGVWLGKKKDPPHVQHTNGLALWDAKQHYLHGGLEEVWAEVDKRAGI